MKRILTKLLLSSSLLLCSCGTAEPAAETVSSVTAEGISVQKQKMYTTAYGTFPLIDSIWENNMHMMAVPSEPGEELMISYLTDDPERAEDVRRQLRELVGEITAECANDEERGRAIAMWVGTNIAYDFDFADDGSFEMMTAERVLTLRRGTCTGFANLFSCLCTEAGIDNLFMAGGTASDGYGRAQLEAAPANHAWNAFYADGEWHFADPTWISDLSYEDGKIFGGGKCLDYYADFDFGGMCIEHRIDRIERR